MLLPFDPSTHHSSFYNFYSPTKPLYALTLFFSNSNMSLHQLESFCRILSSSPPTYIDLIDEYLISISFLQMALLSINNNNFHLLSNTMLNISKSFTPKPPSFLTLPILLWSNLFSHFLPLHPLKHYFNGDHVMLYLLG